MSYNNFIFYKEWLEQLRVIALSGDWEDMVSLCDGLQNFLDGEELGEITPLARLVYNQMTAQIMRDKEHLEEVSATKSENGKKGAEARWGKTKDGKAKQTIANDSKSWQTMANDGLKEEVEEEVDVSTNVDIVEGSEPVLTFPLAKGKTFAVTQEIFNMLAECYPNVDTMEQLRKLKAWAISNPKRRKVDGMKFLNNWFSFEQDKGPPVQRRPKTTRQMTAEEILAIPTFNPWAEAAQ